ncbi:MAG: hypothetical protein ACXAC5_02015 [Promethearchaeota archaeon]|jgi:hypothetical protein
MWIETQEPIPCYDPDKGTCGPFRVVTGGTSDNPTYYVGRCYVETGDYLASEDGAFVDLLGIINAFGEEPLFQSKVGAENWSLEMLIVRIKRALMSFLEPHELWTEEMHNQVGLWVFGRCLV